MKEENCIGVDVSKETLDIALFNGVLDWKCGHTQVANSESGFKVFLKWTEAKGISPYTLRVCMEYTGLYCQGFRRWLESEDIIYYMVNPMKMHRYEVPENIKGLGKIKTDKTDAYRIAIYCFLNHHLQKPDRLPSPAFFQLRRLMMERRQYIKQTNLYKQQEKDTSEFDTQSVKDRKHAALEFLNTQIDDVDKETKAIIYSDGELKKNYHLLLSVIGIGHINAVNTIVMTENFTAIDNPRQYASYIGVAPFPKESGTSVRGKTKVSVQAFSRIKADLSISAISSTRFDPLMKAYWNRKKAEGKHTGVVLNAVKFKLILRMFAVIKRQKEYVKISQ